MPHIKVDENLPGIRSLLAFRPETAAPIGALAEILLRSIPVFDEKHTNRNEDGKIFPEFVRIFHEQ